MSNRKNISVVSVIAITVILTLVSACVEVSKVAMPTIHQVPQPNNFNSCNEAISSDESATTDCNDNEDSNSTFSNLLSNPSFNTMDYWFDCGDSKNWDISSNKLITSDTACIFQTNNALPTTEYSLTCLSKRTDGVLSQLILAALDDQHNYISQNIGYIENDSIEPLQISLTTPQHTKYIVAILYSEGYSEHQKCHLSTQKRDPVFMIDEKPVVKITSPVDKTTFTRGSGASLNVKTTASDEYGSIVSTKLYIDNQQINQQNDTQLEWTVNNGFQDLTPGEHSLRFEATDDSGKIASETITFTVSEPPVGSGTGLYAEFFNSNSATATPVQEKVYESIELDLGTASPAPLVSQDNFKIRWQGEIQPRYSGVYTFYVTTKQRISLDIDNTLIMDNLGPKALSHSATIELNANQKYPIVLDYIENDGPTAIKLEWSHDYQTREVVPAQQLYPAKTVVSQAGTKGEWSGIQSWPVNATHMANLKDGRVIAWSAPDNNTWTHSPEANQTVATIFNPKDNTFQSTSNPTHDMYCAGVVTLSDGSILAAGGGGDTDVRRKVSTFDGSSWTRLADMPNPHWYGSAIVDDEDNVLVSLGENANDSTDFLSNTGVWKNLSGVNLVGTNNYQNQSHWYPEMHLTPRGTIFHSGPTPQMHEISTEGSGTTVSKGSRNQDGVTDEVYRQWTSAIMIDVGKIMMTGGKINNSNSADSGLIIDINDTDPFVKKIAPMKHSRTYHNTIILPNGEIFVVGGNGTGIGFSDDQSRLVPEIYNPISNSWREVEAMNVPRNYHSTATLLQDGRVLTAGGGACRCDADHQDGQIYSPPYLFTADGSLAERPYIDVAPSKIGYDQKFDVTITGSGATTVTRFSLIKFSAVTHNSNSDLRHTSVQFENQGGGIYQLTTESNRNIVTPGYYYLFALNNDGVPSVAKILQIK